MLKGKMEREDRGGVGVGFFWSHPEHLSSGVGHENAFPNR